MQSKHPGGSALQDMFKLELSWNPLGCLQTKPVLIDITNEKMRLWRTEILTFISDINFL